MEDFYLKEKYSRLVPLDQNIVCLLLSFLVEYLLPFEGDQQFYYLLLFLNF